MGSDYEPPEAVVERLSRLLDVPRPDTIGWTRIRAWAHFLPILTARRLRQWAQWSDPRPGEVVLPITIWESLLDGNYKTVPAAARHLARKHHVRSPPGVTKWSMEQLWTHYLPLMEAERAAARHRWEARSKPT